MKLSRPKNITFWISVALGALGLIEFLKIVPAISAYVFWLVLAGSVLLILGHTVTKVKLTRQMEVAINGRVA